MKPNANYSALHASALKLLIYHNTWHNKYHTFESNSDKNLDIIIMIIYTTEMI